MKGSPPAQIENGSAAAPTPQIRVKAFQPIDNRQATIDNSAQTTTRNRIHDSTVWEALRNVMDPEIPVLSVVDMGMIAGVQMSEGSVVVDLTPTFVGCPAIDLIRSGIRDAVLAGGAADVEVRVVFDPPWTSDRITPEGRRKLHEFGLAPPGERCGATIALDQVPCPYCNSTNTEMDSMFGPTLCRSIHYCNQCRQSFEHFKPV